MIALSAKEPRLRRHGTPETGIDREPDRSTVAMPSRRDDMDGCERETVREFEFVPDDPFNLRPADVDAARPNYTEAQQLERARLLGLIDAEKRAFLERVEPYVQTLAKIDDAAAEPPFVSQSAPR
jgi:hypothetical protein